MSFTKEKKSTQEVRNGSFWGGSPDALLSRLETSTRGLTTAEAAERLRTYGYNHLEPQRGTGALGLFLSQFRSPIILILLFAAVLSFFLGEPVDATIVLASSILGLWQEKGATDAVRKLLAMVQVRATTLRDGCGQETPLEEIVPGDIVILSAGDSVPGDCRILESKDLHVDEATLTGETYPLEKEAGTLPPPHCSPGEPTRSSWVPTSSVAPQRRW